MRKQCLPLLFAASVLSAVPSTAEAAESAFGSFGLGGNAFSAGITPPPGTYISTVVGFYHGEISGTLPFQGLVLNAGAKIDFFTSALAALYVPDRKVLGGNLGLSVSVPFGHVDFLLGLSAGAASVSREVDGWGLGDVVPRVQLGWQNGDLATTIWLQTVTRPRADTTWAQGALAFATILAICTAGILQLTARPSRWCKSASHGLSSPAGSGHMFRPPQC